MQLGAKLAARGAEVADRPVRKMKRESPHGEAFKGFQDKAGSDRHASQRVTSSAGGAGFR